jgi:hypothetical protein
MAASQALASSDLILSAEGMCCYALGSVAKPVAASSESFSVKLGTVVARVGSVLSVPS